VISKKANNTLVALKPMGRDGSGGTRSRGQQRSSKSSKKSSAPQAANPRLANPDSDEEENFQATMAVAAWVDSLLVQAAACWATTFANKSKAVERHSTAVGAPNSEAKCARLVIAGLPSSSTPCLLGSHPGHETPKPNETLRSRSGALPRCSNFIANTALGHAGKSAGLQAAPNRPAQRLISLCFVLSTATGPPGAVPDVSNSLLHGSAA
jgi:hypothetical protein